MKTLISIVLLLLIFTPTTCLANQTLENTLQENIAQGLGKIDFSEMQQASLGAVDNVVERILQIINGNFDDFSSFADLCIKLFFSNFTKIIQQLTPLAVVIIILGLVRNNNSGIMSQNTQKVVSFVGVSVVISIILETFVGMYNSALQVIQRVSAIGQASMPILLTLMVANGGNAISNVCQPSMAIFCTLVIEVVRTVIMPLSAFSVIFVAISSISSSVKIEKAASTLTSISSWLLSIVFVLFSAFTSVQGIVANSIDGVSFRMAKFATKSYVPILGGYLADGFDFIVASTSLIKNAFGLVCLCVLLSNVIEPILTIIVTNLALQIINAVCEPIADGKYTKLISGFGKWLTFLAVLLIAVSFMFCILIVIAIMCGNGVI